MWKSDKPEGKRTMAEEVEAEDNSLASNLGRQEAADDVSAFVGKGVEFKGTISYNGTVRIDGSLDGEIHTDGVLLVGEEAVLTAKVTAGTIVCIIEAMKIFNEIPADLSGTIVEVCVENKQPVEYGQVLFRVDPAA